MKPVTLNIEKSIIAEAERCVMCGLCLPHCPTYQLTHDENESPRGRISLMKAVADGVLALSPRLQTHLDNCLLCRACESACPSGVHFGQLMDQAREMIFEREAPRRKPSFWLRVFLQAAISKPRRQLLHWLLYIYQLTGTRWLASKTGILKLSHAGALDALLPDIPASVAWKPYYPATHKHRGDVALFTGCIANIFDRQTLDSSIAVLNRFGYGVYVPEQQACCGALHQHRGNSQQARKFTEQNLQTFSSLNIERIVVTASGCELTLLESLRSEPEFSHKITDISAFLLEVWPEDVVLEPVGKRLAIHIPCTQRLITDSVQNTFELLANIPGLELHSVSENSSCCGAAGSYMLEHPQTSQQMSMDIIRQIEGLRPEILLTSNFGCGQHLSGGISHETHKTEIMHPVVLMARQLAGLRHY